MVGSAVYRKPTHTDLYLQWDSHHSISSEYSLVGTLHHRAKTICSSPQLLQQEEDHLSRVEKMQVCCMGNKQSEDQDENTSSKEEHQEQCKQSEELSETIHSGAILPWTKGEHKENMWQVWGTSPSQGRCYHQEPPGGPQRPRSHAEKEWDYLQI